MWCPNNFDINSPPLEDFYPGHEVVDWICFDAYNGAGIFNDGAGWASPSDVMTDVVKRLRKISEDSEKYTGFGKPLAIAEVGTTLKMPEPGMKGKEIWLDQFYTQSIAEWNVSMIVYFNQATWSIRGYGQPDVPSWPALVDPRNTSSVVGRGLVGPEEGNRRVVSDEVFWGKSMHDVRQVRGGVGFREDYKNVTGVRETPKKSGASNIRGWGGVVSLVAGLIWMQIWM
jgi:hypothetical protein